jgi:acyl carrier protein
MAGSVAARREWEGAVRGPVTHEQETPMTDSALLDEVAQLIIEALHLEGVSVADIDPDAPLFGEGLGLDSIDALELALAISQRYGVQLSSDDPNLTQVLGSLRSLCDHIRSHAA